MNIKFKTISDLEKWINENEGKLSIEEVIMALDEHKRLIEINEKRKSEMMKAHLKSFKYEIESFEGSTRTDRIFVNEEDFDKVFSNLKRNATRIIVKNQRTGIEISCMIKYLDEVDFKKLRED